jgi:hypothetical protein
MRAGMFANEVIKEVGDRAHLTTEISKPPEPQKGSTTQALF